jgi:hypothetical protein
VVHGSSVYDLCSQLLEEDHHCQWTLYYRFSLSADKSLARPTSRCILFDGETISFDASLVLYIYIYIYIYIYSTNFPPIVIINRTCLFVFLALQPTVVVFSQPGSGL